MKKSKKQKKKAILIIVILVAVLSIFLVMAILANVNFSKEPSTFTEARNLLMKNTNLTIHGCGVKSCTFTAIDDSFISIDDVTLSGGNNCTQMLMDAVDGVNMVVYTGSDIIKTLPLDIYFDPSNKIYFWCNTKNPILGFQSDNKILVNIYFDMVK